MRKYEKSDYAINKFSIGIVYQFADSYHEISTEDYLKENPDKDESDFIKLKAISDEIYYEQDREETNYARRKQPIELLEKIVEFSSPFPNMIEIQQLDEENALRAARQLLEGGSLTEIQKRRFAFHFYQGLSYRQIAQKEHVYYTSVRDSIQQAVRKMKNIFDKM